MFGSVMRKNLTLFVYCLSTAFAQQQNAKNIGPAIGDGGSATQAEIKFPSGIAIARNGDIFVAERGAFRVRKIDKASGTISTIAGVGVNGYSGDDGPATEAMTSYPEHIAFDSKWNLYITEYHGSQQLLCSQNRRSDWYYFDGCRDGRRSRL